MLAATRALADYFEAAVQAGAPAKAAANWISAELLRRLKDAGKEIAESPRKPGGAGGVDSRRWKAGEITAATGKKVFAAMFETGKTAAEIIAAEGLAQISDTGAIESVARASGREKSGQRGEISQPGMKAFSNFLSDK